jgi:hypothetical protein
MYFLTTAIALVVAALLVLTFYFKLVRTSSHSGLEDLPKLPMTLLQKRAWFGLGIGLAVTAGVLLLMLSRGPTQIFDDAATRYSFYGLIGIGGLLWLLVYLLTRHPTGVPMDERDRAILAHAPAIQSGLIVISLAFWMIGLTEVYRDEGAIPIVFATLIFWSSWIMHMLGLSIGVLFGYWRARTHAEG